MSFHLIEGVPLASVLSMAEIMDVIDEAFVQQGQGVAVNLPRRRIHLPNGLILGVLPGAAPQRAAVGVELYCDGTPVSDNRDEREALIVYDATTGALEGMLIGCYVNSVRTGAVGGVGAKYLSREDARILGILGTGLTAKPLVQAVCTARRVRLVRVYSPTLGHREEFCRSMAREIPQCEFQACSAPAEAVQGADIVGVVTNSRTPVLEAGWISAGALVVSVANGDLGRPRDELGPAVFAQADRVVLTSKDTARVNESDAYRYARDGVIDWGEVDELCEIVSGTKPARRSKAEVTIFKLPGMGMLDVALAKEFLRKCKAAGLGQEVGRTRPGTEMPQSGQALHGKSS